MTITSLTTAHTYLSDKLRDEIEATTGRWEPSRVVEYEAGCCLSAWDGAGTYEVTYGRDDWSRSYRVPADYVAELACNCHVGTSDLLGIERVR